MSQGDYTDVYHAALPDQIKKKIIKHPNTTHKLKSAECRANVNILPVTDERESHSRLSLNERYRPQAKLKPSKL